MQWLRMSSKDFRNWAKNPSKYHAQKTTVDNITYDSKKEAKRATELGYLQKIGQIKDLQRQVRFILQESYVNNEGKSIRPISYIADFVYSKNNQLIAEDCKGFKTKEYLLKKKIFMFKYPQYKFIES